MSASRIELYKTYVGDLSNIGARYTATNAFYVSITSALIGVYAFTGKEAGLGGIAAFLHLAIPSAGFLVSWIWYETIKFYSKLFGVKLEVLREIESVSYFEFKCYSRERELLEGRVGTDRLTGKKGWLTTKEGRVPKILMGFFSVMFLVASYGWWQAVKSF